jgi:hypothetical protein
LNSIAYIAAHYAYRPPQYTYKCAGGTYLNNTSILIMRRGGLSKRGGGGTLKEGSYCPVGPISVAFMDLRRRGELLVMSGSQVAE